MARAVSGRYAPSGLHLGGLLFALCLLAYGLTAAPFGHALDAGELTAAGVALGVGHPPGQPLSALLMHALSRVPLGPLTYRVALASALAAAGAVWLAYRATLQALRTLLPDAPGAAVGLAAVGAGLFGFAPGVWMQAMRPEVYALNALTTAGLLEAAVARLSRPANAPGAGRTMARAGLFFGLGCANHHLLTLLLLPVLLLAFAPALRQRGLRPAWFGALAALLGLSVYAYLPLRSLAGSAIDLGQPDSWARFVWVVSAQAFQQNALGVIAEPWPARIRDGLGVVLAFGPVPVALALGGAYLLLRKAPTRRLGLAVLLTLAVPLLARMGLGSIRHNPDAQGYLAATYLALGLWAAAALAIILRAVGGGVTAGRRGALAVMALIGLVAAGLCLTQFQRGVRSSLSDARLCFELELARRMPLPAGAVVLLWSPESVFLHWGAEVVDGGRPDVLMVPVPLLRYPGMVERLTRREPAVAPLLSAMRERRIPRAALAGLAEARPLVTELDARLPEAWWPALVPEGLRYRHAQTEGAPLAAAAAESVAARAAVQRAVGPAGSSPAGRDVLLWQDYQDVLYLAARGLRQPALARISLLEDHMALPPQLHRLRTALHASHATGEVQALRRTDAAQVTRFQLVP